MSRQADEFEVTLHTAATALATPTTGVALHEDCFHGSSSPRGWILSIDFSTTATLTDGKLCRKHGAAMRVIAVLNDGNVISGESGLGFEQLLQDIGGDPADLYAVKGTISTGNVTIKLRPVRSSRG